MVTSNVKNLHLTVNQIINLVFVLFGKMYLGPFQVGPLQFLHEQNIRQICS